MNAIRKAVDDVKNRIPRAILEKTFIPYNGFGRLNISTNIDEQIIQQVIKSRVLHDCNIVGGLQAIIPLEGLITEKPSQWETVIRVPKERTQGKSIFSVLNIAFISPAAVNSLSSTIPNYSSSNSVGSLLQAGQALLSSFDSIPIVSTARAQLIGDNVILVRDNIYLSSSAYLRCMLENDEDLSNIQLRSYRHFSNLVVYAVKAYIYNTLIINIDQSQLQGGYELGVFKDKVLEYSDAEENYQNYLEEVWSGVAFMNDDTTYSRFISLNVGSGR